MLKLSRTTDTSVLVDVISTKPLDGMTVEIDVGGVVKSADVSTGKGTVTFAASEIAALEGAGCLAVQTAYDGSNKAVDEEKFTVEFVNTKEETVGFTTTNCTITGDPTPGGGGGGGGGGGVTREEMEEADSQVLASAKSHADGIGETLEGEINAEQTARQTEDAALDARVTALEQGGSVAALEQRVAALEAALAALTGRVDADETEFIGVMSGNRFFSALAMKMAESGETNRKFRVTIVENEGMPTLKVTELESENPPDEG